MSALPTFADPILPTLFINPAATTVNVGDTFTVNIDIAGVTDLFSYNFDLSFDPNILSFLNIVEGDFPKSGVAPGEETIFFSLGEENPGTVSFITSAIIGSAGVTGGGTLATATFTALMAGTTFLTFPDDALHDFTFSNSQGNPIDFSAIDSGSVNVSGVVTVPEEPSTMILLVSALALAACRSVTRES